jgi:hypothetical protein
MQIRIAEDLFGPMPSVDPRDATDETLLVESAEPERAARALARAAALFLYVAYGGELLTPEQADANDLSPDPLYTPSHVTPVYRGERGPFVIIDANGHIDEGMGRTMIRLVTEELVAAGIESALICPAPSGHSAENSDIWLEIDRPHA